MYKIKISPAAQKDIAALNNAKEIIEAIKVIGENNGEGDEHLNLLVRRPTVYRYKTITNKCIIFYRKKNDTIFVVRVSNFTKYYIDELGLALRIHIAPSK